MGSDVNGSAIDHAERWSTPVEWATSRRIKSNTQFLSGVCRRL
jgi:hypothetical protein